MPGIQAYELEQVDINIGLEAYIVPLKFSRSIGEILVDYGRCWDRSVALDRSKPAGEGDGC